ncbi:Mu transposase C-terminal domain-containing protein [Dyella sp. 20L07]|uniref:Mu transposase C-terminal domain-containing protein n=1 Tax=Dyella sp. 20L07 TaxID=3384240 RepID=UPI003D281F26
MNDAITVGPATQVMLVPGDYVRWAGRPHEIVRILSLEHLLLRDVVTSSEAQAKVGEILPMVLPGVAQPPVADRIPPDYLEQAAIRERILRPYVQGLERMTRAAMDALCKSLLLKPRRIQALIKQLKQCPRPAAIASHPRGPAKGKFYLAPDVECIIQEELKKRVRSKRSSGLKPIFEAIELSCHEKNLKTPSRETIRQRVELYARELALRVRHGFKRARERTSAKAGVIRTTAALALVECDHTPLDIFLVDSESRQNIGRAFLTVIIDCHTRAVLGFYLSLDPPCATSVALAVHHAILPKDQWLAERSLGHLSWPMFGIFEVLQVDGGAELNSAAIEAGCLANGIELRTRHPGNKEEGGIVERSIGKIQFAAADEPGASGSSPKYRREYDPAKDAQMTMTEAEVWVVTQIISFFHKDWHETIQMSPDKAWELAHTTEDGIVLPPVVTDSRRLLLDFLPYEERVISPNGIHIFSERYWVSELAQHVGADRKFRVKYDARNVSRIYVEVADGAYIDVPFADPSKEALPLFEHKHRRREARRTHREEFDHKARMSALKDRNERRSASKQATKNLRRKERIFQARTATAATHPASQARAKTPPATARQVDYGVPAVVDWTEGDV